MKKNLIKILCIMILGITLVGCGNTEELNKLNETIAERDVTISEQEVTIAQKSEEVDKILAELNDIKNNTKEYISLNKQEKELVDNKIVEVKQATKDELAKQKAEAEAKKVEEERLKKEAEEEAKRQAEAVKYETGLTWEQIAREGKKGVLGKFEGEIIQVVSAVKLVGDKMGYKFRVAISGNYDTIMMISCNSDVLSETLLEGDYIYFKGESLGTTTYETVMGAEVTVPALRADEITR